MSEHHHHGPVGSVASAWDAHWLSESSGGQAGVAESVAWVLRRSRWSAAEVYTRQLRQFAGLRRSSHLVELGCGCGKISFAVAARAGCEVTCVDASGLALEQAQQVLAGVEKALGRRLAVCFEQRDFVDGEGLAGSGFDIAFNAGVLEHWSAGDEIAHVIRRMGEHCRPGGSVLAWVPNAHVLYGFQERYGGFRPPVDQAPMRPDRLAELFRAAGLAQVRTDTVQPYLAPFLFPRWLRPLRPSGVVVAEAGRLLPKAWTRPLAEHLAFESMAVGVTPSP
jgi:SAM-dependent methyltransferase